MMRQSTKMPSRPIRQRGIVAVMAVIFLITAVIFVLTQSLNITGTTSIDNKQQLDSTAALFLAESGLERARYIISTESCADVAAKTGSLASGSYSLELVESRSCGSGCTLCTVRSTGTVTGASNPTASRTVQLTATERLVYGKVGRGDSATLSLINDSGVPAIGLYNTGIWGGPGDTGASISITDCQMGTPLAACPSDFLKWNTQSASGGSDSNNDMGVSVPMAINANSRVVLGFSQQSNFAILGGLFPGFSSEPNILGSYWKDNGSDGSRTVYGRTVPALAAGKVTNGVMPSNATCDAGGSKNEQGCNNWCTGADTLVLGISGLSEVSSNFSNVSFNTSGANSLNMELLNYFPREDSLATLTGGGIYSRIYYLNNPNFSDISPPFINNIIYLIKEEGTTSFTSIGAPDNNIGTIFTATGTGSGSGKATPLSTKNASSYKGNGTGAIGATITASVTANGLTLNVTAIGSGQVISLNDSVYDGVTKVGDITAFIGSSNGGVGSYTINGSGNRNSRTMTVRSNILNISQCTLCFFANGDVLSGTNFSGKLINGGQLSLNAGEVLGGIGRYPVSGTATTVATSVALRAGTLGNTIYLPSSPTPAMPPMPSGTNPFTKIAVYSGPGAMAVGTEVTAVNADPNPATKSFTISSTPTTPIDLAQLCVGACAFFNNPSSSSATTEFKVASTNTARWAGGFTCLSGVDRSKIAPIVTVTPSYSWNEVIR